MDQLAYLVHKSGHKTSNIRPFSSFAVDMYLFYSSNTLSECNCFYVGISIYKYLFIKWIWSSIFQQNVSGIAVCTNTNIYGLKVDENIMIYENLNFHDHSFNLHYKDNKLICK